MDSTSAQRTNLRQLLSVVVIILTIVTIVLAPEIVPALSGREGLVWTPFNSANFRLGDMYYYAPMIQQVAEGYLPPFPANQLATGPTSSPEQFRWLSYAAAAFASLFVSDPRIVLLWAIVLPCLLSFIAVYGIYRSVCGHHATALFAGLIMAFYFQFWQRLTSGAASPWPQHIADWLSANWRRLNSIFENTVQPYDYYAYSEMFRFLMPITSSAFLAGFLWVLIQVDDRRTPTIALFAIVSACLMAFSYPPHTLVAYLLLVTFASLNMFTRDWRGMRYFMVVGISTLAFLFIAAIPMRLFAAFDENTFIAAVYSADASVFEDLALSDFWKVIVSKYTLTFLIALWLSWPYIKLRRLVIVVGSTVLVVSVSAVLPPLYSSRILYRGVDHIWFLVLIVVFCAAAYKSISSPRLSKRFALTTRQRTATTVFVIFGLLVLPLIGFSSLTQRNLNDARGFVVQGQWSTYEWLRDNAKDETIAALNWDDISFIAVYLPHVRTVFGAADLSNRRPEVEMERFVAVWKELGLSRETFLDWVTRSLETELERRKGHNQKRLSPLLPPDDYAASRIALALIYFPYVRQFDGVAIAGDGRKRWTIRDEFIEKMLAFYDRAPATGFLQKENIQTLVVSAFEEKFLSEKFSTDWQLHWSSQERKVYKRISNSSVSYHKSGLAKLSR